MAVIVTFNSSTYSELFAPIEASYPGLAEKLRADFQRYVESDRTNPPHYFGRDVCYTQPPEALKSSLMHIHIKLPPGRFPQDRAQYYRVCQPGKPGQDAALVNVQGELEEESYQLLAFLWPDAHGQARQRDLMRYLARLAQEFRDSH